MACIGIIGTGNMGGMLAKAFAHHANHTVYVVNRTMCKATELAAQYDNMFVADSVEHLCQISDVVWLCTKARDGRSLLAEIGPKLGAEQFLVTTISSIPLLELEQYTAAAVAIVIPSIVQQVRRGIILVGHGPRSNIVQKQGIEQWIRTIAEPFPVEENQLRVASDLTSCGPALMGHLLLQWSRAAAETGKLSMEEANHLLTTTFIALAKLLESGETCEHVIEQVAVPGGVTETALDAMDVPSIAMFRSLHQATQHHLQTRHVVNLTSFR